MKKFTGGLHMLKDLIIRKLKNLSYDEILYYSQQYGFSLSEREALDIKNYLQTHGVNPFHEDGRLEMFQELAHITNVQTAKKAQQLFNEMIKSYGVEHLFTE